MLNKLMNLKFLASLIFAVFLFCNMVNAQNNIPIPDSIKHLLDPTPGMKAVIVGLVEHKGARYYLINETEENIGGQKLICVEPSKPPRAIAMGSFLFPLKQFKLPPDLIKKLALRYVRYEVASDPNHLQNLQQHFNQSPQSLQGWPRDLLEAYRTAGLKIPRYY